MTLQEKHQASVAELQAIRDPQERLAFVVRRGRESAALPAELRSGDRLIPGCLSRLWLLAEVREGRCYFLCDSDSAVVKGIASMLCGFFSGAAPEEILAYEGDFLAEAGIQHHLTPNRRQGLGKVRARIREFAVGMGGLGPGLH